MWLALRTVIRRAVIAAAAVFTLPVEDFFGRLFVNIDDKCVVSFHYTLTDGDGEKLDSSDGKDPLNYLHGAGNIVPGLENALNGKAAH